MTAPLTLNERAHRLADHLDWQIIRAVGPALESRQRVQLELPIRNVHRAVFRCRHPHPRHQMPPSPGYRCRRCRCLLLKGADMPVKKKVVKKAVEKAAPKKVAKKKVAKKK